MRFYSIISTSQSNRKAKTSDIIKFTVYFSDLFNIFLENFSTIEISIQRMF